MAVLNLTETLDLRPEISVDAENRLRQSVDDRRIAADRIKQDLEAAEDRLAQLCEAHVTEDFALILLARSEQVRVVSRHRAAWCKAKTSLEDAEWSLAKLLYMRDKYQELIRRG